MRIVTWNMNIIGKDRARQHDQAWTFLLETLAPDIALLQEVSIPPDLSIPFPLFYPKPPR
jgi:exonuclease III